MKFEQIKLLGEKTNRILELEQQIKSLHTYAADSVNDSNRVLSLTLHQTTKQQLEREKDKGAFENMIKSMLPFPAAAIISVNRALANPIEINLDGRYQLAFFESLISALKQEQNDIEKSIKGDTESI